MSERHSNTNRQVLRSGGKMLPTCLHLTESYTYLYFKHLLKPHLFHWGGFAQWSGTVYQFFYRYLLNYLPTNLRFAIICWSDKISYDNFNKSLDSSAHSPPWTLPMSLSLTSYCQTSSWTCSRFHVVLKLLNSDRFQSVLGHNVVEVQRLMSRQRRICLRGVIVIVSGVGMATILK